MKRMIYLIALFLVLVFPLEATGFDQEKAIAQFEEKVGKI